MNNQEIRVVCFICCAILAILSDMFINIQAATPFLAALFVIIAIGNRKGE